MLDTLVENDSLAVCLAAAAQTFAPEPEVQDMPDDSHDMRVLLEAFRL